MDPEQALQIIIQRMDAISGFTPPQVRQMDQAFQSLAALIVRDKAAKVASPKGNKKGES